VKIRTFVFQRADQFVKLKFGLHYRNESDSSAWILEVSHNGTVKEHHDWDARELAFSAFHRCVARYRQQGFVLVVHGVPLQPREPRFTRRDDLEAKLDAAPNDDAAWDALIAAWRDAEDPRGAAVDAIRALTGITDPKAFLRLRKRADEARCELLSALYGALGADDYRLITELARGLVSAVHLEHELHAPGHGTRELVTAVLSDPACRFVQKLSAWEAEGGALLAGLADVGHPHVRDLDLVLAPPGTITLAGTWPNLERLRIAFCNHDVDVSWPADAPTLPALRSFAIQGVLSMETLSTLLSWCGRQPQLADVAIATGGSTYRSDDSRRELARTWFEAGQSASLRQFTCDGYRA